MTIRATSLDGFLGYGVEGVLNSGLGTSIRFDIRSIAENLPLPQQVVTNSGLEDVFAYMISLRWRLKVNIVVPEASEVKRYDDRIGLARFGQAVFSDNGYRTNREFIDFQSVISKLYLCQHLRLRSLEEEPPLPCDEPPVDLDIDPVVDVQFKPQTSRYASERPNSFTSPFPGLVNGEIGSQVIVVPENETVEYGAGITYLYAVTAYTQSEYESFNPNYISL